VIDEMPPGARCVRRPYGSISLGWSYESGLSPVHSGRDEDYRRCESMHVGAVGNVIKADGPLAASTALSETRRRGRSPSTATTSDGVNSRPGRTVALPCASADDGAPPAQLISWERLRWGHRRTHAAFFEEVSFAHCWSVQHNCTTSKFDDSHSRPGSNE
jgi:hypothetical protein